MVTLVRDNGGKLSNQLLQEFPLLADEPTGLEVAAVIGAVFAGSS